MRDCIWQFGNCGPMVGPLRIIVPIVPVHQYCERHAHVRTVPCMYGQMGTYLYIIVQVGYLTVWVLTITPEHCTCAHVQSASVTGSYSVIDVNVL